MEKGITAPRSKAEKDPLFADLPPYEVPTTGLLSYVPRFILPFAELARIDKPGFIALWLVHAFGILHAGLIIQVPPGEVLRSLAFFVVACQILMSVNFAWNDSCDSRYDGQVARTRHRPIVRGAISLPMALIFDAALATILAGLLTSLPQACTMCAIPMAFGCFVYPLSKRWTNYPQLVLAVVLSSGVFMGASAVGAIPLPYPSRLATCLSYQTWNKADSTYSPIIFANYPTSVVWTVFFEMLYSYQDAKWDEAAGVGTMTRLLKNSRTAKAFLVALATTQTALHAYVGILTPMRSIYWPLSVAATFATLSIEIFFVDLGNEESCMFWFAAGNMLTGLAMLVGYAGEYYNHVMS